MILLLLALLLQDSKDDELLMEMDSEEPEVRQKAVEKAKRLGPEFVLRAQKKKISAEVAAQLSQLRAQHRKQEDVDELFKLLPPKIVPHFKDFATANVLADPDQFGRTAKVLSRLLTQAEPMDRSKAGMAFQWLCRKLLRSDWFAAESEFLSGVNWLTDWRDEHQELFGKCVEPFLDSPHPRVRENALDALQRIGWRGPAEKIVSMLQSDEDKEVRLSAKCLLGHPASLPLAKFILPLLNGELGRDAIEILSAMGCTDAIPLIAAKLDIPRLRDDAAYALAKFGAVDHFKKIASFLPDTRDPRTLLAAGMLGIQESIPALRKFARDDSFPFRKQALIALSLLGVQDHVGEIERFCSENKNASDHFQVMWSLNAIRHPEAFRKLFRTRLPPGGRAVFPFKFLGECAGVKVKDLEQVVALGSGLETTNYYDALLSTWYCNEGACLIADGGALRLETFEKALEHWRKQK